MGQCADRDESHHRRGDAILWAFLGEFPAAGLAISWTLDAVAQPQPPNSAPAQEPVTAQTRTGDADDR